LLAVRFVPQFGWSKGLFCGLFYAISAFNNAGFSLFPDSLTRWATDPWINLVIAVLIIIGGLGFSVQDDLRSRRRGTYLSLHSRLTLVGTAVLLMLGFAGFAILEWHNPKTLGLHASVVDRLLISFFQSVTTRTAGFNTIDIASLNDSTTLMTLGLMFIGGGSTSSAGGIKVSSFMVLVIVTWAFLRRSSTPGAFGRTIPPADVLKVFALTSISSSTVVLGTFALTVVQPQPFLDLLFETVSSLATVGLSRGISGELTDSGRIIVTVMMFIGRVGPLTLGLTLARNTPKSLRFPEGRVYLG
jgi:trk system potassium uptake protein TrkH